MIICFLTNGLYITFMGLNQSCPSTLGGSQLLSQSRTSLTSNQIGTEYSGKGPDLWNQAAKVRSLAPLVYQL